MGIFLKGLQKCAIVLVRPKYPENIGFAARTARNLGIAQLVLVGDAEPEMDRVRKTATHNAGEIVEAIQYYADLPAALSEYHLVVGTTARKGRGRQATLLPGELAGILAPVLPENRAAIVFGPEDRGLSNEELRLCGYVASIPTADFTSLNLSHAVAVFCHEIFQGLMALENSAGQGPFLPRLASLREQGRALADISALFSKLDAKSGKAREKNRLIKMRALLGRRALQAKETRFVSEICREITAFLDN
jgi:tRNA/rRNA methyltransferase